MGNSNDETGKMRMLTRPKVTEDILSQIRQTIEENPDWGRMRISIHLCELWDWRVPGGQVKDISCRDMLRLLDKAGKIKLPEPQNTLGNHPRRKPGHLLHKEEPIACGLGEIRPLSPSPAVWARLGRCALKLSSAAEASRNTSRLLTSTITWGTTGQ